MKNFFTNVILFFQISGLVIFIIYAIFSISGGGEKIRYKVTVTVTTPEGDKTGYAVREAVKSSEARILPQQGGTFFNVMKGEAVIVDLGTRGTLFSLIGNWQGLYEPVEQEAHNVFNMFPDHKKGRIVLTPGQYPTFARFKDLNNPKTIENVLRKDDMESVRQSDPRRPIVDFDNAFGEGVSIKEVTFETTTDNLTTTDAEKYLPWLSQLNGRSLVGRISSGPEWYERLDSGAFERNIR